MNNYTLPHTIIPTYTHAYTYERSQSLSHLGGLISLCVRRSLGIGGFNMAQTTSRWIGKGDVEKTPLYVFLRQRDEADTEGYLGRERVLCFGRDGLQMIDILGGKKTCGSLRGLCASFACFCLCLGLFVCSLVCLCVCVVYLHVHVCLYLCVYV